MEKKKKKPIKNPAPAGGGQKNQGTMGAERQPWARKNRGVPKKKKKNGKKGEKETSKRSTVVCRRMSSGSKSRGGKKVGDPAGVENLP